MKTYKSLLAYILGLSVCITFGISACQKFDRPDLVIIADPLPPPYNPLKSLWQFENNTNDEGENKLRSTAVGTSYAAGISGQGIKFAPGGYLLIKTIGDTVKYPNEFVGLPADTIRNLGSFTLSFWINGVGPVTAGAQGLFAISHKTQFWGNLEIFLENLNNAANPSEGFLKIHMYNASVANGGEEWNEIKLPILNRWTQLAITYDGNTSEFTLFVDGQPTSINKKKLGGGNYGKLKYNEFNGMVLGSYAFQTNPSLTNHGPEDWARSFTGTLDQVRLYNKALTPAEINEFFTTKK